MTTRALIRSLHRDAGSKSGNRFFESERKRHLNIRAFLRLWPRRFAFCFSAAKQIGKDIPETAAAGATCAGGRAGSPIKAGKIERRAAGVGGPGRSFGGRVGEII